MNLNEMDFDKQVGYLRSLLSSGKNSNLSYFALFAFRHHLASKHSPNFTQKPLLRWYLGQLAKEYIARYLDQAKSTLESFAQIGLLEAREGEAEATEYHLNESLYPALMEVLEEVFGKDYVSRTISRAKYYRNPRPKTERKQDQDPPEVRG
jgi:hypothetical protein